MVTIKFCNGRQATYWRLTHSQILSALLLAFPGSVVSGNQITRAGQPIATIEL